MENLHVAPIVTVPDEASRGGGVEGDTKPELQVLIQWRKYRRCNRWGPRRRQGPMEEEKKKDLGHRLWQKMCRGRPLVAPLID